MGSTSLGDAGDGNANYLPGYNGTTQVLNRIDDQKMQVIVSGLKKNTVYKLWIDLDGSQTYTQNDTVIFDYNGSGLPQNSLAFNDPGTLLGNTSNFWYARRFFPNDVGAYSSGDYIYMSYAPDARYNDARDQLMARSIVGVTSELPLDSGASIMIGFSQGGSTAYTANGLYVVTDQGAISYIDPPSTFKDADQDTKLQLRE